MYVKYEGFMCTSTNRNQLKEWHSLEIYIPVLFQIPEIKMQVSEDYDVKINKVGGTGFQEHTSIPKS